MNYRQPQKAEVRHKTLLKAIEILTSDRQNACCVKRNYPRKVYDYFYLLNESKEKDEVSKVSEYYLRDWEKLHDTFIGNKRPEDLIICYLSGPEPKNDFNELVKMGVLPQNIWAFENDKNTYGKAINELDNMLFPKPKILRMPIEQFLKNTPKKFDIIYIDACGSIPSEQHALRCISSICKYHRLNSPGVILTNFAEPDFEHIEIKDEYIELLSLYFWCKNYPNDEVIIKNNEIGSKYYTIIKNEVTKDIKKHYGEFVRRITMDISSVFIPILRMCNSSYMDTLGKPKISNEKISLDKIKQIKNNSLWKFCSMASWLKDNLQDINSGKIELLLKECMGLDGFKYDINTCFDMIMQIKNDEGVLNELAKDVKGYFEKEENLYQFLDKPSSSLFFDTIINQLAYPLHYVTNSIDSYRYKAKETNMYLDTLVVDECRYIYEWLPTINQMICAFEDLSWQYVFRFALDGLVKCRIRYNNETYFRGSVICDSIDGFKECNLKDRNIIS